MKREMIVLLHEDERGTGFRWAILLGKPMPYERGCLVTKTLIQDANRFRND
jgi:hypothetical protein